MKHFSLNPQHTVPTFDDDGFVLRESRAIMKYLVDAYAKDDTLAPKEAKAAALVNERLYFDSNTLYDRLLNYFKPILFMGQQPDMDNHAKVEEALGWLNLALQNQVWAAGQYMTIADFALVVTVSTAEAFEFNISKYPNVHTWYQRCQKAMADYGYEADNQSGCDQLGNVYKSKMAGN